VNPRSALLRLALRAADGLVGALPTRAAYWLADLAGSAWYRFSPARRALVAENLRRVCEATGRPVTGRAFRSMVHGAFVAHARYYLELLRATHYPLEEIDRYVTAQEWDRWEPMLRQGVVVASMHFGSFEPYGAFLTAHRVAAVAPVEEIRPLELYEFLRDRRASGRGVRLIPLRQARRALVDAIRRHELVALISDRDLSGDGLPVTLFGHATTLPSGPAWLALATDAPLLVAACYRIGPDRFDARAWQIETPRGGDRRADLAALTETIARRFEEAIAAAPEQWWGAFQPIWDDQRRAGSGAPGAGT
jgi:phosphatidylinositol dimannoside acyltransferase